MLQQHCAFLLAEPQLENFSIGENHQFENGINITIQLNLNESVVNDLFYYVISTSFVQNKLCARERLKFEVLVLYNVLYDVSVVSMPRCGRQQNSTLLYIGLFYCKSSSTF